MNIQNLIAQIKDIDLFFKGRAAMSIDKLLTIRNWLIGSYIVEYELKGKDRAEYGEKIIENIAKSIDAKGLSFRNLKLFKQFYIAYPQIGQTVSALFEKEQISIGQTRSAQSLTTVLPFIKNVTSAIENNKNDELVEFALGGWNG